MWIPVKKKVTCIFYRKYDVIGLLTHFKYTSYQIDPSKMFSCLKPFTILFYYITFFGKILHKFITVISLNSFCKVILVVSRLINFHLSTLQTEKTFISCFDVTAHSILISSLVSTIKTFYISVTKVISTYIYQCH